VIRVVENVLDSAELASVRDVLERVPYLPGRNTAKGAAADVKHNLQATPSADAAEAELIVLGALQRSKAFQNLVLPARISTPMFVRYEMGMSYGRHHDSARVGGLRADASVTLFLTDGYDGGELLIEGERSVEGIKLEAGSAVVYSSGTIHRVAEVTRGVRLVATLWIESHVQDDRDRDTLRELAELQIRAPNVELELGKIRAALFRRWS
jgi:PKHD-type hydroxylase